jgi:hypothetical protein
MLRLLPSALVDWNGKVSTAFERFFKAEHAIGVDKYRCVKSQLSDYAEFLAGNGKATVDVKYLAQCFDNGDIPKGWRYPRCVETNPMQYIGSLSKKLEQLNKVIESGNFVHPTLSLAQCFDPRSFLMASQQMAASDQNCSVENLQLDFSFERADGGYPIHDLYIFGAKLNQGELVLIDDIEYLPLPTGYLKWTKSRVEKAIAIPVYANSLRDEVLFHYYVDHPRKALVTTRGVAIISK